MVVSEMIFGSDSKHKRKAKSNNWNYSRGPQNKTDRNEMKQETIFAIHIFSKGLISKIYKEFIQLNSKQRNKKKKLHLKEGQRSQQTFFSKEDILMANGHRKRCFTSVIIKETQIHTKRSYPLTSTKIAIIKQNTNKCWQGCGEKEILEHCWWECKLVQPVWKTL